MLECPRLLIAIIVRSDYQLDPYMQQGSNQQGGSFE